MPPMHSHMARQRHPPGSVDHLYNARGGFIYTSASLSTTQTERPSAVLLLSATGKAFQIAAGNRMLRCDAALIGPLIARTLHAPDVGLLSINIHPTHAAYVALQSAIGSGFVPVRRDTFSALDGRFDDALDGGLGSEQGSVLFDDILERLCHHLPQPPLIHPQRSRIRELLSLRPDITLGEMAKAFQLSYHRMSHLFAQAYGLPFRTYGSFDRMRRASVEFDSDRSLTEIAHAAGFTDSAHLTHTWQRRYGLSPSYLRSDNCVQAIS